MNLGHLDFEVVSGFDIRISDLPQLLQPPIEQYVGNDPRTKLRCSIKYDPLGNRVYKKSTASGSPTERKYVVDITGNLPTILLEINPSTGSLTKTYIYGNCEILAQHEGDTSADRYFYLHDRLGSVRLVIDDQSAVKNTYTYEPFGQTIESGGTLENPFRFTGQYFDSEIEEYYLRARQYNPQIARFTARDPARGKFARPPSSHRYLYCYNDPLNYIDPDGRVALLFGGSLSGNVTARDLASGLNYLPGALQGILAATIHNCMQLPIWAEYVSELATIGSRFGWGATYGAGFVGAWDHTRGLRGLNDADAWSWGAIEWGAGGFSGSTGSGVSMTLDIGISNATHVSQLGGWFIEGGGSGLTPKGVVGGTLSMGVDADGPTGIWLGTFSWGLGTKGGEGHVYVGYARVTEGGEW